MDFNATNIPYSKTNSFSKLVLDYLSGSASLEPFYSRFPKKEALLETIEAKSIHTQNRKLLTDALMDQYQNLDKSEALTKNITLLNEANTFTITTAHQPNIFTGPLYFIYKILHAVRLAEYCSSQFPQYHFVPVYYMGSEDADLDELGHIYLKNEKLSWDTKQTGAVGRMRIDDSLLQLIKRIESEIGVLPHGHEIMSAIKTFYTKDQNIQTATLGFVNYLFGRMGLVVVVPDNRSLKSAAIDLFKDELLHQRSSGMVAQTAESIQSAGYKAQTHGRDINLFYLKDDGQRLRIEKNEQEWTVLDTEIKWNEDELLKELNAFPKRFSPNVILRGIFQEMILPNIAFIGGGGELAYWLELKKIFDYYQVPYPLLILRNSFLLIDKRQEASAKKLGFQSEDLFGSSLGLKSQWVKTNSQKNLSTEEAQQKTITIFDELTHQAAAIDPTLKRHIYALQKQQEKNLITLSKKMMRAEKRNYADAMRQIDRLKQELFPQNNLQERIENILWYWAQWGIDLIDALYEHSGALEQQFVVLEEA